MIFGKGEPEKSPEDFVELPEAEKPPEKKEEPEEDFAPLFIKIERYREITNKISSAKATLESLKSSLSLLRELEKLREESLKVIEGIVSKLEKKLDELDAEFLKRGGILPKMKEVKDVEKLLGSFNEMKSKIEEIKAKNI
jgi:DNA repair ATPase RecN